MKSQWKKLGLGLMLFALPLMATSAAVAADSQPLLEGNRSHQISLNRAGAIEGRISTGQEDSELNVYFVRDGKIVRQTRTTDGGYFVADNMAVGPYSFVATGQNGFAAYGVQVGVYINGTAVNAMESAAISTNFSGLARIVENNMPAKIASEIMAIENGADQNNGFTGENVIQLVNGQLNGRVASVEQARQAVEGTEVYLIQDNQEVARTTVDQNGQFIVTGLESGVYDFIAAGSNGIAAIRFQAINEAELSELNAQANKSFAFPVSYAKVATPAAAASLDVCLTCQQDNSFVGDQIDYAVSGEYMEATPYDSAAPIEYASEAVGCGCAAGGSCGSCGSFSGVSSGGGGFGGGGFGGGGGVGRLIGLGGLAGGIIAISTSGDSNSTPVDMSPNGTN